MTDRDLGVEEGRAMATVTQCEIQLRRAQEGVRRAGEVLRRAVRTAETAQGDLGDATDRLDRVQVRLTRVG
jgi:hypothetical protein